MTEADDDPLFEAPEIYELFAAIRELMRRYPDRAGVGGDAPPSNEVVRFVNCLLTVFPSSEVTQLIPPRSNKQAQLAVKLLTGLLPSFVAEWILDAKTEGQALKEFIDLFVHRPISLWYALSEKLRPGAAYEHHQGAEGWWKDDVYVSAGLQASGANNLPRNLSERFAGVLIPLGRYVGTLTGYEQAAATHLGVPIRVVPLQGTGARTNHGNDHTLMCEQSSRPKSVQ